MVDIWYIFVNIFLFVFEVIDLCLFKYYGWGGWDFIEWVYFKYIVGEVKVNKSKVVKNF